MHERFARYEARRGRNLDLPTIAATQLREAGVEQHPRQRDLHDLRRALLLAPRAATRAARQGSYGAPDHRARRHPDRRQPRPRARTRSRARAATRPSVQILAAVKYVALEEMGTLAEAGVTLLGENRAQELEAKADGVPRLHLALHRPAAVAQGQADPPVRAADPLGRVGVRAAPARGRDDTDPARGQRRRRGGQGGDRARRAPGLPRALAGAGAGPDDDAAVRRRSRGQPPAFRAPAGVGARARSARALDGHEPGLRGRCSRRCNDCANRHDSVHLDLIQLQGKSSLPRT